MNSSKWRMYMKSIHLCLFANKTERAGCWKTMDEIFKFHPLLGSEKWNPFVFLHLVCCYRVTFHKPSVPDQAFPWIPGLAPQCPHLEVHDGISEHEHLMEFNWSFVSSGTRTPFLPPSGCWFLRESAFSFLLCCFFFFFFLSESNGFLRYTVVGVSGDSLLETCPTQMESACCPWKCECQEPQSWVESPEVFKRHSLRAKRGADFSAATETPPL